MGEIPQPGRARKPSLSNWRPPGDVFEIGDRFGWIGEYLIVEGKRCVNVRRGDFEPFRGVG